MKLIYSSKMYTSSKRKDKIRSAMDDPINLELMQQLRRYLDDEYQTDEYLDVNKEEADVSKDESDSAEKPEFKPFHVNNSGGRFSGGDLDDLSLDDESKDFDILEGEFESADDAHVDEDPDEEISEAIDVPVEFEIDTGYIKSVLDENELTSGVSRVSKHDSSVGDDELWIYYKDSVNLNNVMEPVIDKIQDEILKEISVSFSRLARSDNAIVFTFDASQKSEGLDETTSTD